MWYLISVSNPDVKYVLLTKKEYVVGRKDCDIILTSDPAVSRKHATLVLSHQEANLGHPHKHAILTIKDLSKFGTFINKNKAQGETVLNDGDKVMFGSSKSTFCVVHEPFVVTTSCLDSALKKQVKATVCRVGGHLVGDWRKECCLVVMSGLSVTIKVICALLSMKSMVMPEYLEAYVNSVEEKQAEPKVEDFLPDLAETQLNPDEVSFKADSRREKLFEGKVFIFLSSKQFKKLSMAVELAGGVPMLMEEGSDDDDTLLADGTVVMHCDPADDTQNLTAYGKEWVSHVQKSLKRRKKRMIPEAEIGYAVLFCSTESHCNPNISAVPVMQSIPSQTLSQHPLEVSQMQATKKEVHVPNTEPSQRRRLRPGRDADPSGPAIVEEIVPPSNVLPSFPVKTEPQSQPAIPAETPMAIDDGPSVRADKIKDQVAENTVKHETEIGLEICEDSESSVFQRAKIKGTKRNRRKIQEEEDEVEAPSGKKVKQEETTLFKFDSEKEKSKPPEKRMQTRSRSPSPNPKATQGKLSTKSPVVNDPEIPSTHKIVGHQSRSNSKSPASRKRKSRESSPRPDMEFNTVLDSGSEDDLFGDTSPEPKAAKKRLSNSETNGEKNSRSSPVGKPSKRPSPRSAVETKRSDRQTTNISDEETESASHNKENEIIQNRESAMATDENVADDSPLVDAQQRNETVADGWFCARQQAKSCQRSDYVKEEDMPANVMITEFADLIMRKPRTVSKSSPVKEGYVRWKGKLVKNCKKFKKVLHKGADALPRIIGGSDLEEHHNTQRKELDEWFRDAQQAQSQQNQADRNAQALFNWEPRKNQRSR